MSKIIGKVRFNSETKITNGNFIYDNYSQNPEYIKMLTDGNFIDVTEEQYQFIRSNNDNGIDVCVIDGVLHACIEGYDERLQKLKQAKNKKSKELEAAYYANEEKLIINIPFNGRTEYLDLLDRTAGINGLKQALGKIENDVALSEASDLILPLKYQGIERMYYIYVTEFSRNRAIKVIIMKQSKRQELITFFQNAITQYTVEYDNIESDVYVGNYAKFFVYWEYREQLDALTTIEEVQAFTFEFTPLTLTLPEEYIEDVQYNNYD